MEDKKNSSDKTSKKGFWTLGDKTWIDLLLPFIGAIWTGGQFFFQIQQQEAKEKSQRNAEQARTLENYFTSLQVLQNDIFKYNLLSNESTDKSATANVKEKAQNEKKRIEDEEKRIEAATIIQSLAIAKTLIAFESLDDDDESSDADEKRKGQIIEYLHNSNLVPKSYSDYDSSNNYICTKLTKDRSIIHTKMIDLSDEDDKDKAQQKVQVRMNDVDLTDKLLPGISLAKAGLKNFNFKSANLDCSSFKGTTIENTKFKDAQLRGANFSSSFLKKVDFSGSVLSNTDFSRAFLADVNLEKANLEKADLSGANFQDVKNLTHEQIKSACNWEKGLYKFDKKWNNEYKINNYIFNKEENIKYIEELKLDIKSNPKEQPNCV